MKTLRFTVTFDDDIGTPEQNEEAAKALAYELEALLLGYHDGDGEVLQLGHAYGMVVRDGDGSPPRDVRAVSVHYSGGA